MKKCPNSARLFFAIAQSGERKNNFIMRVFTGLYLIFLACSVLCNLLYPTILDAQMSAKEAERLIQKFEQVELNDLLKDESYRQNVIGFFTRNLKTLTGYIL